jgi:hypothetical protein
MIKVSEVIEACARVCDSVDNHANPMTASDCAAAIRALAAKYEGCIVAEGAEIVDEWWIAPNKAVPLYRAMEPTK